MIPGILHERFNCWYPARFITCSVPHFKGSINGLYLLKVLANRLFRMPLVSIKVVKAVYSFFISE
jgi:hypothetical protein